ncbi:hypothetical protein DFH08DRAFT_780 [Mycena albidolilacea]|uniref:Uncharacterized protein n=1 Tax=Mycena albidolilacea TaxID=1033008 RepID=A0AAD7AT81_9AGAR|nr:hypothetical protein DFH08DRAFT_780 [Mycena albidolilacea]
MMLTNFPFSLRTESDHILPIKTCTTHTPHQHITHVFYQHIPTSEQQAFRMIINTAQINSSAPVAGDAEPEGVVLALIFLILIYIVACSVLVVIRHITGFSLQRSLYRALSNIDGSALRSQIEWRSQIPLQPVHSLTESQAVQVASSSLGVDPQPPGEDGPSLTPGSFNVTVPLTPNSSHHSLAVSEASTATMVSTWSARTLVMQLLSRRLGV